MSNAVLSIYPWQHEQWALLVRRMQQQRMPHALLLAGPEETGKQAFAHVLANYMVCRQRTEQPCGCCKDCLLYQAGTHPDIMHVMPEDKHRQILIQQVRDVVAFLGCYSNQGGYRVVIVSPAESMNTYAANALLKSLEEPGEDTLLILVSQRPESLLPTIRSRCQQLSFPVPAHNTALTWLQEQLPDYATASSTLFMAQGRPLAALRYVQENEAEKWSLLEQGLLDITLKHRSLAEVSESWKLLDITFVFQWVILLIAAMVRCKMTRKMDYLHTAYQKETFLTVMQQCADSDLIIYYDWLVAHYGLLTDQVNLNTQLLIESLLARWQDLSLS